GRARPDVAPRLDAARVRGRKPRAQIPAPARRGALTLGARALAPGGADAPRPADAGRAEAAKRAPVPRRLDRDSDRHARRTRPPRARRPPRPAAGAEGRPVHAT